MSPPVVSLHQQKSKALDGKYMLGDEIGKGAYGRVYKGLDLENGDFVAIKQVSLENIPQEDLNIIMQEIDLLKNLNHKNIVKYLGSLKTKTHLHIILEYVENGSLENIIKPNKFGPFTESLAVRYISQVLEGLVYLHEQGVIHRDIKGANILTTKEGLVKLADFGVATKLNEADLNTHSVVGTPYWMAPEVIEMSGVCAASDIWSVGCTVIELLTCVPPYYDLQPMPALFRIVQDVHPPIPDGLSSDMVDFLHQCFKKDAMQRPDAKTLLLHPWIQNKRHTMQKNHLETRGTLRIIESGDSVKLESIPCDYSTHESSSRKIMEIAHSNSEEGSKGLLPIEIVEGSIHDNEHNTKVGISGNHPMEVVPFKMGLSSDQDLTLPLHENTSISSNGETNQSGLARPSDVTKMVSLDEVVKSGNVSLQESNAKNVIKGEPEREGYSNLDEINHFPFEPRIQEDCNQKVFDDNLVEDNTFPLQALEFGKLVSFLKPEESEDTIVSACQKVIMFFHRRPEQKHIFLSQHGLVPLMELLALPKIRVVCSVLQIINQIIKDNINFQENACLIGLIPDIMSFAKSDRPREVRMEAAFFFQQLCQSSSLTLQMFIACHGIPVLVDFLEPDYAKYRVMVHLAIDGMWQVFKLQHSLRNDFCRIAAKSGILIKLINAIHSLNEATQLSSLSEGSGSLPPNGSSQHPQSGLLDSNHHFASFPSETPISYSGQLDQSKFRQSLVDSSSSTGSLEPSHITISNSQTSGVNQSDVKPLGDVDKHSGSHDIPEASVSSKFHDVRGSVSTTSKDWEQSDIWKLDSSRGEVDSNRKQRVTNYGSKNSIDSLEPVLPLLSLLEKEPRSRHASGHLEYVRHLSSLERRDNFLSLVHGSTERKTNGELDFLPAEFPEVSRNRKEIGNLDSNPKIPSKIPNKLMGSMVSNEGSASRSGVASHAASGVLSGSGVLNARSGSATSSGILTQMVSNADVAREYLEKVADLLLEFSQADSIVKTHMCSQSLLSRLFQMFNKIEPPILLKILKCLNNLSTDPNCLDNLQRSGAIRYLIPNLDLHEGQLISHIHNEVLKALFNLCKINKRRQEQAAESGIIPHLMNFITSGSPLKQYALPLLCDMAHASRNSREQLRAQGGLDIYLNLLEDENWAVTALDSLAVCLAHDNDNRKVEQALLKKEAIQKLVKFFEGCPEQYFVHILEPLLKIITKSSRINTTLAVNGLTALLIAKLGHHDAIVRLNLLKLIKAVYEHHPRPKQLIVENDLPQMLQNLIEERRDGHRSGGQVLVKQMATALLKALHINTVL